MSNRDNVFGKRVKQLRLEKGLSQGELGKLLGYSDRSTIAKIEAGKNTVPTEKLKEFSKVLSTTVSYLLGSLEDDLYVLGVTVSREDDAVCVKDRMSDRVVTFDPSDWKTLEERNDFQYVWNLLDKKEKTLVTEGQKSQIQELFDQLSPANQSKLIELAHLYLASQRKTKETP